MRGMLTARSFDNWLPCCALTSPIRWPRTVLVFHVLCIVACGTLPAARATDTAPNVPSGALAETNQGATSTGDHQARPYGLERRVAWTTSRITGSPEPPSLYQTYRVFENVEFKSPVEMVAVPGNDYLLVIELDGKIHVLPAHSDADAVDALDLAIDLRHEVEGLTQVYGLTFHPNFEKNHYCYVVYVLKSGDPNGTRVSRFTVETADPPRIDAASEKILITWRSGGHNGSCLKFGPDGYLYISTGDGGPAFPPDPLVAGQDVGNLLSAVLRIDVDQPEGEKPYRIPNDNPFVGVEGARGEIWAYGFRNPWRMGFDPVGGDLWLGDVGWELWEMVDRVERGGNYGWSLVEGTQPVHRERQRGPTPIIAPTIAHSHVEGRSVTGGCFYYGERLPNLRGAYIYGDYVTGKIWGLRYEQGKVSWHQELVDTPLAIVSFGLDHAGELYILDHSTGTVHQLAERPAIRTNRSFPTRLSETGLFDSVKEHVPAPGVIPYDINAEPWADGTVAERFVAIPGLEKLHVHVKSNAQVGNIEGEWKYPSNSVLAKTISLRTVVGDPGSLRRLETQILHYDVDTWKAYSYVWNEDQTDAILAHANGTRLQLTITDPRVPQGTRSQTWRVAARTECLLCHTTRGGSIYGFNIPQLNRDRKYGTLSDNQLRTLEHIGLFQNPLPEQPPKLPDPYDVSASIQDRARAYLHINCAHCHRRGGGGTAAFDVQFDLALDKTNLIDTRPTQGTFGIHRAQVVAPGDPYRSVLYYRMMKLGRGRMPYFGSQLIDDRGSRLIRSWIAQLPREQHVEETEASGTIPSEKHSAVTEVFDRMSVDPEEIDAAAVDRQLSSVAGALQLLHAIDNDRIDPTIRELVLQGGGAHSDVRIRDLFERFLPEEQRTKRLGSVIKPAEILSLAGSRERGQVVFLETAGVTCKNCHRIDGAGAVVGPDLSHIGEKQTRAQLLESMLEPSRKIDPKFVTYLVETKSGRVYTGLLESKSADEAVFKSADNKTIRIRVDDVELMLPQQESLMPELLLRDMTAQQVADLLQFLRSLK